MPRSLRNECKTTNPKRADSEQLAPPQVEDSPTAGACPRKRLSSLGHPVPWSRVPTLCFPPVLPAMPAPPPTAGPNSACAASSPVPGAVSCAPQALPAPSGCLGFRPTPSSPADRPASLKPGPPACPLPVAVAPRHPCALSSRRLSWRPAVLCLGLCFLFSCSHSLHSIHAFLRSSFCHFRPTLHGPSRPRKRNMSGNPAPESPRKHLVGFTPIKLKNPVSFPSPAHLRRGGGPSKFRKALSCPPFYAHHIFRLPLLSVAETGLIICKRFYSLFPCPLVPWSLVP